jgi:hypothetical protein
MAVKNVVAGWNVPASQHRGSYDFKRNEYGHVVLTLVGIDLSGMKEIARLEGLGFQVTDPARSCFKTLGEYDNTHKLTEGEKYKVALMPGSVIDAGNTSFNKLRAHGMSVYGYGEPLAGLIPRICEDLTYTEIQRLGFLGLQCLHRPLKVTKGKDYVLCVGEDGVSHCSEEYLSSFGFGLSAKILHPFPICSSVSPSA